MEFLYQIFGEGFDLAAVASGAGVAGGGASAAVAVAFSGAVKRFIVRMIATGVFTGAGFLALLHFLGFQIVPPEDLQQRISSTSPFSQGYDDAMVGVESAPADSDAEPVDERTYAVCSPFRKNCS